MYITAFFTNNGVPATGLIPTIKIRKLSDNSLVVTDAVMVEVGDGIYKYNFTGYNASIDYAVRCDGGDDLQDRDRYSYGTDYAKSPLATAIRRIVDQTLEIYNENGVLLSFNLYDDTDNPSATNVYKKEII